MASDVTQALTPNLSLEDAISAEMERTGRSREQVLEDRAQRDVEAKARADAIFAEHDA